MRAREFLSEDQTLSPDKLTKDIVRFQNLKNNIKTGKPLYLQDGTKVIISPAEADRLEDLYQQGLFKGRVMLLSKDGQQYPLSNFLKTKEYGGQAIPPGQEGEVGPTKEGLKLKPSDIGLQDKNIPAGSLGKTLVKNESLNASETGKIVIELAKMIANGQPAILPKSLDKSQRSAINDYAGEYLGVWALIKGQSNFPNREKFEAWMQTPITEVTLWFPSKANTSIADSYALIDPVSGHQINISSKGKGGGAPPSIAGLKIPEGVRNKKQYSAAIQMIEIIQNKNLPKPTTVSQPFVIMNMINEMNPKAIPAQYRKFLPWPREITEVVKDSMANGTPLTKYQGLWQNFMFKKQSADGGKLTHAVKETVREMVNSGAIPEFEAAILEILDYNFIQQDTVINRGTMVFTTRWPAKIEGKVTLESKSGATDPTKGSFSFKLNF
jgi:hypothetical protein